MTTASYPDIQAQAHDAHAALTRDYAGNTDETLRHTDARDAWIDFSRTGDPADYETAVRASRDAWAASVQAL